MLRLLCERSPLKGGSTMRASTLLLCVVVFVPSIVTAQMIPRQDYVWARTSTAPITVDGVLNETVWSKAESVQVVFGQPGLMPGSGWHQEGTPFPSDPTRATLKFLVWGDSLYVAVVVKDSSVGGGPFNRMDAFLMNLRDKEPTGAPGVFINPMYSRSFEFFYGWVTEEWADPATGAVGADPGYFGFVDGNRDSVQRSHWAYPDAEMGVGLKKRQIWDARTTVQGLANSDTTSGGQRAFDEGYTTELKFNLALRGYNVTRTGGDTVMWSISIYDADWRWPIDSARTTGNRVWLQNPWGNAANFGHMKIIANPSVTTETAGPLPSLAADVIVPNGQNFATPVIDGDLSEAVWQYAPSFKLEYGNDAVRAAYPGTGKYRSGQYQTPVNNQTAPVLEPSPATVKYFFKGDTLYLGFDVNDQVVSFRPEPDHRDGFRVTINDRQLLRGDTKAQFTWDIRFFVDTTDHGAGRGRAGFLDHTLQLDTLKAIKLALNLKPGSDVDTLEADPTTNPDQGYTAELAIDLTKLGYPAGRGDGVVFLGVTHYDGDFFAPIANSYAVRTWWFRELQDLDGPAWAYLDPNSFVTSVGSVAEIVPQSFELLGNYPNPFNPSTTVRFTVPQPGYVTLHVFDILGRKVAAHPGGYQETGVHQMEFPARGLSSGAYFYYLELTDATAKTTIRTRPGKMLLLR